jgi:hypothetical protein
MQRSSRGGVGVLAGIVMLAVVAPAYAQTQGMERRDEHRDNRAGGRAAKQACKAGDEKTRAECRQVKHTAKHSTHEGGGGGTAHEAPATNPTP